MRVLILEDDADTRDVTARLLTWSGHEVQAFADPAEISLHCEAGNCFDLLISDIGLPGEDGCQLLPKLRAKCGPFRAIAVTGFASELDVQRCREAGFDACLAKPVSFANLLVQMTSVCQCPQQVVATFDRGGGRR